jgi:mono/diheme cytochrome c family protein
MTLIRRGMPGTSMPAFAELTDTQRNQLAELVLHFHRLGVRERLVRSLEEQGEQIDNDEVEQWVRRRTTPHEPVAVPSFPSVDTAAAARGEALFHGLSCSSCHPTRADEAGPLLFDEGGYPTTARDLAYEPLKGGSEAASIYLRIRLGLPGTPHPAYPSASESELVDLVHYCRSLSREPKRISTNYQRRLSAARMETPSTTTPASVGPDSR